MKKKFSVGAIVSLILVFSTPALAFCKKNGYVYVSATCIQARSENPKGICQVKNNGNPKNVAFYSNVIYDNAKNTRFPTSQFDDELQLQYGEYGSAQESYCYSNKQEASDALRKDLADLKGNGWIIKRVRMGPS